MREMLLSLTQLTQSYRDKSTRTLAVSIAREAEVSHMAAPTVDHDSDNDNDSDDDLQYISPPGPSFTEVESRWREHCEHEKHRRCQF